MIQKVHHAAGIAIRRFVEPTHGLGAEVMEVQFLPVAALHSRSPARAASPQSGSRLRRLPAEHNRASLIAFLSVLAEHVAGRAIYAECLGQLTATRG
jgi:hypothetical protein